MDNTRGPVTHQGHRPQRCVYCGHPCYNGLACGPCKDLLEADPVQLVRDPNYGDDAA